MPDAGPGPYQVLHDGDWGNLHALVHVRGWTGARGHDVEVICEVPDHSQGIAPSRFVKRALVPGRMEGLLANCVSEWHSGSLKENLSDLARLAA